MFIKITSANHSTGNHSVGVLHLRQESIEAVFRYGGTSNLFVVTAGAKYEICDPAEAAAITEILGLQQAAEPSPDGFAKDRENRRKSQAPRTDFVVTPEALEKSKGIVANWRKEGQPAKV